MGWVHRWAWIGLVAGCSPGQTFACVDDQQCAGGAAPGICHAGWCGFEDPGCASGYRYGEHAGDGLAGACVAVPGDDTVGSATAVTEGLPATDDSGDATADGSTSVDPTDPTDPTGAVELPDPIAWYTFDDPEDIWADASGNELHAWCADPECGLPDVGVIGGAIRLDGLYDHGHVDHMPLLETYDGFTLTAWAWPNGVQPTLQAIISKPYDGGTDDTWQLGLAPNEPVVVAAIHPESWGVSASAPWPLDSGWHHVAATWDGEVLSLYVDGALDVSAPVAPVVFDPDYVLIGADDEYGDDDHYFGGLLDDVRIYDSALSAEQIEALAAG
ncbi:MAG: LamG domain-containing protein [Myxococcales bacterium]|nr:LamG domain-containing protein [Myxococcales bacterium]